MVYESREHFDNISECWYQRTHSLRRYSEDETKSLSKRVKARMLFMIMIMRMQKITNLYIKINQKPLKNEFKKGGII